MGKKVTPFFAPNEQMAVPRHLGADPIRGSEGRQREQRVVGESAGRGSGSPSSELHGLRQLSNHLISKARLSACLQGATHFNMLRLNRMILQ